MTQDKGVVYRDNLDIDIKYDLLTLKNYKLVQPGDFIISLRSFQGGFETSYLTGITSPAYTIFNFIDNQDKDHAFWQYLFKRIDFINSLKRVTFGIRDGKAISFSQFGDVKVEYPSFDEQKHIATVLTKLDNTLQLHERKCEELTLIKKSLLQKLFPKEDKIKPEIRYKNFSDAWEQRKLGEVAEIKTGSRNHQDSVDNGKYPFFVRSEKVERLNEYDFDTKAILVPGDGRIGEIFHYYDGKFALHQRVYKVDNFKEVNPLYLLNLFKYKFKKHALRLNAQGTVPSLRLPMFTNWNILIPNLNEQQKIGLFFQQLDSLIALHQRKLEKLKQLKKFLLQNMFI
ncbi:restriction endonuclease subunit S [Ligilactobacillus salivarius]|uniref:restriction endonuclease subunit S n=1 Tax=Ligilactobacillus salivarius TaxID=1624 RepID=UPI0013690BFC